MTNAKAFAVAGTALLSLACGHAWEDLPFNQIDVPKVGKVGLPVPIIATGVAPGGNFEVSPLAVTYDAEARVVYLHASLALKPGAGPGAIIKVPLRGEFTPRRAGEHKVRIKPLEGRLLGFPQPEATITIAD